jgi:hypothetical protein
MKTVTGGTPKFDSVFLGEIQIDLLAAPDIRMSVTAGYVDSKTGRRLGYMTKLGTWSQETLTRLNALIESIEVDTIADVFEGTATTNGGLDVIATPTDGVPGL